MGIVLLTGATGFVGSHLPSRLVAAGFEVRCATRDPGRARGAQPHAGGRREEEHDDSKNPAVEWVELDSNRSETLEPAMRGVQAAIFLIHGMGGGPGYEERESRSAKLFAEAAVRAGLERIVYLGGVEPRGVPSRHLSSRLVTGQILRSGLVPVFELRASMIIGKGSISWQIVRDLAARLPAMLLPRWLATRSQPVAIDDVVDAIMAALILPLDTAGPYDLPGPETLTAKEILFRIAALRGRRPLALSVPVLTPRLSSYWLQFVTGADYQVARELVEGLSSDLVASGRDFWSMMPGHRLVSFDDAARRAMAGGEGSPARRTRLFEWAVSIVSRRSDRGSARGGSHT